MMKASQNLKIQSLSRMKPLFFLFEFMCLYFYHLSEKRGRKEGKVKFKSMDKFCLAQLLP